MLFNRNSIVFLFLVFTFSVFAQGDLYWSDSQSGRILKRNLDDSTTQTILSRSMVFYHDVDIKNKKIYWTDNGQSNLVKSNLDGSEATSILSNLIDPQGVAMGDSGTVYLAHNNKIISCDSLGNNLQTIIDNLSDPGEVLYYNGFIYWSDNENFTIERIQANGENRSVIINDAFNVLDIEINETTSELFWVQSTGGIPGSGIYKSKLDGTDRTYFLREFARGIAVDGEAGFFYWSERTFNTIHKTDLNDVQNDIRLIDDYLENPRTISIDTSGNKIYFTNIQNGNFLYNVNLNDGTGLRSLASTLVNLPDRIEIDTIEEKIYWINAKSSAFNDRRTNIMRANIDGSDLEKLLSNPQVTRPTGLALDLIDQKMYWTDLSEDKVLRANLDGSNLEELVTGLGNPTGIALDLDNNKMYWADWGADKIQRADLDGSNVEDLVTTGLTTPIQVAIYRKESKIYWTDIGNGKIKRSDLDGQNVETIITTQDTLFQRPNSVFIDAVNDKLYYTIDFSNEKIQRSNMDGSMIEDVVIDGLNSPKDLYLINRIIVSTNQFLDELNLVNIYPNPVSDILNIKTTLPINSVQIFSTNGQLLYTQDAQTNIQLQSINTIFLSPGIYFCKIDQPTGSTIKKIIKIE